MKGLYWVRTDLRLEDNLTLNAFLKECQEGLILWSPTRSYLRASENRKKFYHDTLLCFDQNLQTIGQRLHISNDIAENQIEQIILQNSIDKIFFSKLSSTEESNEEKIIISLCQKLQIQWESFDQECLIDPQDLPFEISNMPFIFSDFRKKIEKNLVLRNPVALSLERNNPLAHFEYQNNLLNYPSLLFNGGEKSAQARLDYYFWDSRAIHTYKDTRNGMLNEDDSSRLSPWLSQGVLSARTVLFKLRQFEAQCGANESTYWLLFELMWRDYLKYFSRKYKHKIFIEDGVKKGKHYSSQRNQSLFKNWYEGRTDEVFVNANMNELNQTGWMSNRGRQNVASYLVHHLKIPWIWGAAYFEERLIDYDPDLNWGNWLYLSGNGSDPRARVFNIKRQAEVYDKDSLYQKKWAP